MVLFCLGKTSLILSAAENSGYVVLIDNENLSISFAGVDYSLSDDLKNLSIKFQVMDTHAYKGQQSIHFSLICGDRKDEIFIDFDSITRTDPSFFSLKNTVNQIDVFNSHATVTTAFELSFSKKITDNLILEAVFTDASGACSEKTTCVLYSVDEPSKASTEVKEITSGVKEITTEKEEVTASKKASQYSSSKYYINSYSSSTPHFQEYRKDNVTDLSATVKADTYNKQSSNLGVQQIVAIVLAAVMLAAAFVCVILGIKKSKVN